MKKQNQKQHKKPKAPKSGALAERVRALERNPNSGGRAQAVRSANQQQKRAVKASGISKAPVHSSYLQWAAQQSNAEAGHKAVPPFTNNMAQSVEAFTAQTTWVGDAVTVDPNVTRQLTLFGRGKQGASQCYFDNWENTSGYAVCNSGDEVALHSRPHGVRVPGGNQYFNVGPVDDQITLDIGGAPTTTLLVPALGVLSSNTGAGCQTIPNGQCTQFAGLTGATFDICTWQTKPPIVASSHTGHMRWVLTGLTVRVQNISPALTRGGSIVAVSMPHDYYNLGAAVTQYSPQSNFKEFKSFRSFSVDDEVVLHFPTRLQDLAYNHTAISGAQYTDAGSMLAREAYVYLDNAMAHIWLNGPATGSSNLYRLTITADWAIAGSGVATLVGAVDHHPQLRPAIEKASTLHQTKPLTSGSDGVWDSFKKAAADTVAKVEQKGVAMAKKVGTAVVGGVIAAAP